MINNELQPHVYRHLRETADQHAILVHAVGGIEDHVHLAVSIPPSLAIATAVRGLKGNSTRMIREEFGSTFGWQSDYGVSSFGEQQLPPVVSYIENQQRRHARGRLWPAIELPPEKPPVVGNR